MMPSSPSKRNRLTQNQQIEFKQQPMCYACQTKYTVKHILIECIDLAQIRKKPSIVHTI